MTAPQLSVRKHGCHVGWGGVPARKGVSLSMPDIPDSLRIGPLVYRVTVAEVLEDEETKERLWGEICYEHRTITLADGESQTQYASLIHESLHGLLEVTGIRMSESKVHALAYALFGFFCDNPTLFPKWAHGCTGAGRCDAEGERKGGAL